MKPGGTIERWAQEPGRLGIAARYALVLEAALAERQRAYEVRCIRIGSTHSVQVGLATNLKDAETLLGIFSECRHVVTSTFVVDRQTGEVVREVAKS